MANKQKKGALSAGTIGMQPQLCRGNAVNSALRPQPVLAFLAFLLAGEAGSALPSLLPPAVPAAPAHASCAAVRSGRSARVGWDLRHQPKSAEELVHPVSQTQVGKQANDRQRKCVPHQVNCTLWQVEAVHRGSCSAHSTRSAAPRPAGLHSTSSYVYEVG